MTADLEILPARTRGRPTRYKPAYCDRVLELADKGFGKVEIAADLKVDKRTLTAWMKAYPEFCEAMRQAKELEHAWWLKSGREGRGLMTAHLKVLPAQTRGRPTLYKPAYCDSVLELAADGFGKVEIAAELKVDRRTLNAWVKAYPDFREAMRQAKELEYAWWLKTGRNGQFDKSWNAASWTLQMRNRFPDRFSDAKKPAKEKRKEANNADRLREDMERKLSRIADASREARLPGEPDAGPVGEPDL
jgi:hypothetical protein